MFPAELSRRKYAVVKVPGYTYAGTTLFDAALAGPVPPGVEAVTVKV
jgi:hypothetical protein